MLCLFLFTAMPRLSTQHIMFLKGIYQGCDVMTSLTFANPLPVVIDRNTICSLGRMMQLDPV